MTLVGRCIEAHADSWDHTEVREHILELLHARLEQEITDVPQAQRGEVTELAPTWFRYIPTGELDEDGDPIMRAVPCDPDEAETVRICIEVRVP